MYTNYNHYFFLDIMKSKRFVLSQISVEQLEDHIVQIDSIIRMLKSYGHKECYRVIEIEYVESEKNKNSDKCYFFKVKSELYTNEFQTK